jgi:hypothetical protein
MSSVNADLALFKFKGGLLASRAVRWLHRSPSMVTALLVLLAALTQPLAVPIVERRSVRKRSHAATHRAYHSL